MLGNALRPIDTGRLRLVPVEMENLRILWHVMRAPSLREYQDIPRVPFERFRERIELRSKTLQRGAKGRFEWLVTRHGNDEPIGWVSIRFQDSHRNRGELGYSILVPWRRSGYAAEAVCGLTDHIFQEKIVDVVEAFCMPANLGSRGVLKYVGLVERERMRRGAVVSGVPVDVLRFDIHRKQWEHARHANASKPGANNHT